MSRKLFVFLLSELKTIRFLCKSKGCGAACEVPINQVAGMFRDPVCKNCNARFYPVTATNINPLIVLAKAIEDLQHICVGVDVEFVLPDNDKPAK